MITTLSMLVAMIERGTIPAWLRADILAKRDEITKVVQDGGSFTLDGPAGEQVIITAEKRSARAA
jgi:hypothetical protein